MKVKAPDGYHWMKKGKEYKLMKDPAGGYKPHKGATKSADFAQFRRFTKSKESVMPGKKKKKVKKPYGY
jgi:hypothetical protein